MHYDTPLEREHYLQIDQAVGRLGVERPSRERLEGPKIGIQNSDRGRQILVIEDVPA